MNAVVKSVLSIFLSLIFLTGCSSVKHLIPDTQRPQSFAQPEKFYNVQLIGVDLVNALMQVPGKHPQDTLINMASPTSTFASALKQVFENSGYALRVASDGNEGETLEYVIEPGATEDNGRHYTYMISVGEVKMKRDYFVQPQGVTPSSSLYVIGTDPTKIVLNDDIFEEPVMRVVQPAKPDLVADASTADTNGVVISKTRDSRVSPPMQVADASQGALPIIDETVDAAPIRKKPTANLNMYETRQSNYAEYLAGYSDVHQEILIFPNDSMRLGDVNKSRIQAIAGRLLPDTDVVSVIGCSHGRTAIEDGNRRLATGRAQRVMEAFQYAGIDENRILEEGCWAPRHFDEKMPRRGVVVTVKRNT